MKFSKQNIALIKRYFIENRNQYGQIYSIKLTKKQINRLRIIGFDIFENDFTKTNEYYTISEK